MNAFGSRAFGSTRFKVGKIVGAEEIEHAPTEAPRSIVLSPKIGEKVAMPIGLLVIDVQNDYFPGGRMEVPGSPALAERTADLLRAFRDGGRPVVHLQHLSTRPGATFLLPDTRGVEIHPSAAPRAGETVVQKHFPNGFRETRLLEVLRAQGVDRLAICGMMTQMCVDATVRGVRSRVPL